MTMIERVSSFKNEYFNALIEKHGYPFKIALPR